MKKSIIVVFYLMLSLLLASCGTQPVSMAKIDYNSSSIYSKEDMDSAIKLIKKEFPEW